MTMMFGCSTVSRLAASFGGNPFELGCGAILSSKEGPVRLSMSVLVSHNCRDLLTGDNCGWDGGGGRGLYILSGHCSAAGFVVAQGKILAAGGLQRTELTDVQRALHAAQAPINVACVPIPTPGPSPKHGLDWAWPYSANGRMGALMVTIPAGVKLSAGVIARASALAAALAAPLAVRARAVLEELWAVKALPLPPPCEAAEFEGESDFEDEEEGEACMGPEAGVPPPPPPPGSSWGVQRQGPAALPNENQQHPSIPTAVATPKEQQERGLDPTATADSVQHWQPASKGGSSASGGCTAGACSSIAAKGGLEQNPIFLNFKDAAAEREYVLWSNAGKLKTDMAFSLVVLGLNLSLAAVAPYHRALQLHPLMWPLMLCHLALLCTLLGGRGAYLLHREAACSALRLMQIWYSWSVLGEHLFEALPEGPLRRFLFLAKLSAAEPMAVLALGTTTRLLWHIPTSIAGLAIILARLPATCASALPMQPLDSCSLLAGGMAALVGVVLPSAAVFLVERRSRREFLSQHGRGAGAVSMGR